MRDVWLRARATNNLLSQSNITPCITQSIAGCLPFPLKASVPKQQIANQNDEQDAADANPAAIPPPAIAKTATEEEDQYYNNQDQVHSFLRCGFG